jgi:alpha-L-arabinofuranosidase
MASVQRHERKLLQIRQQVEGRKFPLALTECHFTMQGRNRCELNSAWATGVAYARFLNLHQRHGDLLKIANLGDFCGTRWQTNVVMIPTPGGKAYLMPVGKVTALYRKHTGKQFVKVTGSPPDLDIVASRTGDKFYLHVVNISRTSRQRCRLAVEGMSFTAGRAWQIAADPMMEITSAQDDPMTVQEIKIDPAQEQIFPPASVTVMELDGRASVPAPGNPGEG